LIKHISQASPTVYVTNLGNIASYIIWLHDVKNTHTASLITNLSGLDNAAMSLILFRAGHPLEFFFNVSGHPYPKIFSDKSLLVDLTSLNSSSLCQCHGEEPLPASKLKYFK